MHEAGLFSTSQEAEAGWGGGESHVTGVMALPMAAGTPFIRGEQQPCEL